MAIITIWFFPPYFLLQWLNADLRKASVSSFLSYKCRLKSVLKNISDYKLFFRVLEYYYENVYNTLKRESDKLKIEFLLNPHSPPPPTNLINACQWMNEWMNE